MHSEENSDTDREKDRRRDETRGGERGKVKQMGLKEEKLKAQSGAAATVSPETLSPLKQALA